MTQPTFGALIKRRRLAMGLSLLQAGLRAEPPIRAPNWYRIEEGQHDPLETTQQRMAAALGTTVAALIQPATRPRRLSRSRAQLLTRRSWRRKC